MAQTAVITTTNPDFVWDGTQNNQALADGVYFVIASATNKNGLSVTEKQTIHLVR